MSLCLSLYTDCPVEMGGSSPATDAPLKGIYLPEDLLSGDYQGGQRPMWASKTGTGQQVSLHQQQPMHS